MNHERVEELIPAFALGALDQGERGPVEAHVKECAACHALLADYGAIGVDLAYAVPPVGARAGLTEDLRRRIAPVPAAAKSPRNWLAFLRRPALIVAAASVALLLVTNLYWAGRTFQAERQAARLTELTEAPGIPLQANDSTHRINGVLYTPPGGQAALLCVYDMPPLPAGKTYQVWLVAGDRRDSGGLFQVGEDGFGILLLQSQKALESYDGIGITVEPAGGSPGPTSPRVLGGQL